MSRAMGSTEATMLTLQEAADVVGCHYQTLYRRVRNGDIPALVAGGSYRIRREDLDAWLEERDQRAGAVPDRGQRDWPGQADRGAWPTGRSRCSRPRGRAAHRRCCAPPAA